MIPVKTSDELRIMREACQMAATVLARLCAHVAPGMNTYDLDQYGKALMQELGCESACYNYAPRGHKAYPAYTCISVNDEVVHGIGTVKRLLRPGDNVSIDVVVRYQGFLGDNARTVLLPPAEPRMVQLLKTTEEALHYAITYAKPGNRVGDISNAVQRCVEAQGFSVVREFVGHGIGRGMHEDPQIPNYGRKGRGELLRPGMTLAIEPMVNMGAPEVYTAEDGWTARTRDGLPAAHFEHTVLITSESPEILTIPRN